jgi:hypothetical protein
MFDALYLFEKKIVTLKIFSAVITVKHHLSAVFI